MHVCMYPCAHACMHACMHGRMHACVRARMHTNTFGVRIHACIPACMHACMHACDFRSSNRVPASDRAWRSGHGFAAILSSRAMWQTSLVTMIWVVTKDGFMQTNAEHLNKWTNKRKHDTRYNTPNTTTFKPLTICNFWKLNLENMNSVKTTLSSDNT